MAIDFPNVTSLNNGHQILSGDVLYTLNKTSNTVFYWSASLNQNPDNRFVNTTGDNMTGSLGGVTTFRANNLTDGNTTKSMTEVLNPPNTGGESNVVAQVWFNSNGQINSNVTAVRVSSVSKNNNARYTVNISPALPSMDFTCTTCSGSGPDGAISGLGGTVNTSQIQYWTAANNNGAQAYGNNMLMVFM